MGPMALRLDKAFRVGYTVVTAGHSGQIAICNSILDFSDDRILRLKFSLFSTHNYMYVQSTVLCTSLLGFTT